MRRWPALIGAILAILVPDLVIAQSGKHLNPTVGDVWTYFGPTLGSGWGVAGSGGGGGSAPGGSNGMIQYNNAGILGGFLATGDLSINTSTGLITINPGVVSTGKIADGAVTNAKLNAGAASANVGTLGGILTGTLPNPGLLATGITAGSYTCASVTFDASGRATTAFSNTCGSGSGSVTSVGMSVPGSSIFGVTGSPIITTGTLGLTTAGTSGGIPYFSSTSTLGSSGLLAANGFVLGGGAGASPTANQLTGLVKGNGASAPTAAAAGSDYAVPPSGTANTPLFNNGSGGFTNGTRSGNTTTVGTTSGALTSGNLTQFDANGNLVAGAGPGVTGSSLTSNRVIIGGGSSTVTALGSAGTTTTLLHGNAAGAPTFGAVSLTADVSGILASASGGTGINNGSSTLTLGGSVTLPAAPASTQCLHMSSAGAITVTGSDCGSGVTQNATTATITAAQWANWQVFDVQTAGQTLTLPVATSLATSGGILIKTEGNPVTLAFNAADGINGLTVGTPITIPANFMTAVTTSGVSGTTAFTAPLGLVAGSNITITQNSNGSTTLASSGGGSSTAPIPQGRLTLQTGVPVMTADQVAKTTVYYDTYIGNLYPNWNGSAMANVTITSDEISMGLDAVTPRIASGSLYDVFGTAAASICAGPAWTSTTARGTGAGTTELQLKNGVWTNKNALTNCWGGASGTTNLGSISANQATYLGTIYATANGQTSAQFTPASAAGGANAMLGLYNAYNRVRTTSRSADSTSSWTYTTASFRAANNSSSNRITWVDGLAQSSVTGTYSCRMSATAGIYIGGAFDGTSPPVSLDTSSSNEVGLTAPATSPPLLGLHFFQGVEFGGTGGTFVGNGGQMVTVNLDM